MFRVTDKKFELRAKTYDYGLKYQMKRSDDIQEIREAYERFLPAPSDNYNIVKAKLEGMKDAVERSNEALRDYTGTYFLLNTDFFAFLLKLSLR